MLKNSLGRACGVLLALLLGASAFAQNTGSLRVTVTDAQGGVLPTANVTVTNQDTKFTRKGITDGQGNLFFASVEPGNYTISAELTGFKVGRIRDFHVSPSDTGRATVALEVGEMTEEVVVTADKAVISTQTGAREGVISTQQIESMSVLGRNPLELLRVLPGVVAPDQASFEQAGMFQGFGQVGNAFSINGARAENLGITLDGANLRDIGNNSGMMNVPNNEFIAEVKLQSSNYAAEFGTHSISVQAVTKSGSAEFHGSVYDYYRPYQTSANDRSRSYAGQEKPKSKFNYPGFTLSGPILFPGSDFNKNRDKAFFFIGFELAQQSVDVGSSLNITPTAGQRQGLFNDFLQGQRLNQPATVNIPAGFPGAGSPAPNNDLRPYLTDTGRKLIGLYPEPNYSDPNNRYNYIFSRLSERDRNQGIARIDYNLTENTKAYVRLARDEDSSESYKGLWWAPSGVETPTPLVQGSIGVSAVANLTSVLSPTTTNEFIFSFSRLKNDNLWKDPAKMQLATYGITDFQNPFGASPYIPEIVNQFDTNRGSLWYAQDSENIFSYNGFLRFQDNLTKVLDTHALKFGLSVERQYKQQNFQHQSNVQLNFAPWAYGTTGSDFGDLLVGRPASAAIGEPSAVGNFIAWNLEGYAQDSWKASKNFTLEYGIRLGRWTNNQETNDLGAIFLPSFYDRSQGAYIDNGARINGLAYVSRGEVDRALTDSRPFLVMPRVNFAYDISGNGDTIVRGGAGIFYVREQGNAQYDIINVPPNSYGATLDAGNLQGLAGGRGLTYATLGQADPFSGLNAPGDINTVNPNDLAWPRTINASLSVARRIPGRQVVEVGYVGSWGNDLTAHGQQNILQPGTLSTGTIGNANLANPLHRAALTDAVVRSFRPYPTLANVRYPAFVGESKYNALQATLSRQSGAFQYLVAYTLSKAEGTVATDFAAVDPIDPSRSYGILFTDRPHVLNVSWSWRLGQPAKSGIGKALLNDWNISGISTYSSGRPLRPRFSGDISSDQMSRAWWGTNDYANADDGNPGDIAPIYTCDPTAGGSSEVGEKMFNVSCIGIPGFGQTGPNYPTNTFRGPSQSFHDLTVFKDFGLGGSRKIQFRTGFFNLFNQAYANPGANDIDLTLQTTCNVRANGVPDGAGGVANNLCDPQGGFTLTSQTLENFGKIITKRGHRVVEFALRLFF